MIVNYSAYEPPFDLVPLVERMLDSVHERYLVGLGEVVLANSTGMSRKLRRSVTKARKRKVRIVETLGLYHQEWHGKPAWVEIFVDNTLKQWNCGWFKPRFLAENALKQVLFHEIGHHIHTAIRPEYREKEDVADIWKVKLDRSYNKERYKWRRILLFPIWPFMRLMANISRRWLLKKGYMSRAEFEERSKKSK